MERLILCKPGQEPTIVEVEELDLDTMQGLVGGRDGSDRCDVIQCVPLGNGVEMWFNEEGRLLNLPFNRKVTDRLGQVWSIVGSFFLSGVAHCQDPEDGEYSVGLTDLELLSWSQNLALPENAIPQVAPGEIDVYHANNPNFMPLETGKPQPPWPSDFTRVATVQTDDINEAWQKTNHVFHPWGENEGVTAHQEEVRSSSCGDVFVLPDGKAMRTGGNGFCEVGKEGERVAEVAAEQEADKAREEQNKLDNERKAVEDKTSAVVAKNRADLTGLFGDGWHTFWATGRE